jgi:hypothetical protein
LSLIQTSFPHLFTCYSLQETALIATRLVRFCHVFYAAIF